VLHILTFHFQFSCLQVILGASYDTSADMWSLACMIFELVTGDFMFEPRAGREYTRDEDHLAQMIELLGKIPRSNATTGKQAREYFNRDGHLRHIHRLNFWPIDKVLVEKYYIDPAEVSNCLNCY
jgi:serine/threonine-protein kinase SRPK3